MEAEPDVTFKRFKSDDDAVAAANALLALLKPRFAGPGDMVSALAVLLVCTHKAHTKKEDEEAREVLMNHIETVWDHCGPGPTDLH